MRHLPSDADRADLTHLRAQLTAPVPLPKPAWLTMSDASTDALPSIVATLKARTDRDGAAAVRLDRHPTTDEFLTFAYAWGPPIPEHADAVQPFVDAGYVLDLVARWRTTADVDRQPFSDSPILLHTEGSRRPVDDQPRYLLFHCVEAPVRSMGAQTVLVRMEDVAARLSAPTRAILHATGTPGGDTPPVLRDVQGRPTFCFRDFGDELVPWQRASDVTAEDCHRAIRALLVAMYRRETLCGVSWEPHLLLTMSNVRVFHGRTQCVTTDGASSPRHIRRIRVGSPAA